MQFIEQEKFPVVNSTKIHLYHTDGVIVCWCKMPLHCNGIFVLRDITRNIFCLLTAQSKQCAGCLVYHKFVDNLGLVVEYDLREELNGDSDGSK